MTAESAAIIKSGSGLISVSGGVAGVVNGFVIQSDGITVIDPVLLLFGFLGFLASVGWHKTHGIGERLSAFIFGMVFANFSSLGLASLLHSNEYLVVPIDKSIVAMLFGFSGSTIVVLYQKWLGNKSTEIEKTIGKGESDAEKN